MTRFTQRLDILFIALELMLDNHPPATIARLLVSEKGRRTLWQIYLGSLGAKLAKKAAEEIAKKKAETDNRPS